jgi:hypothetical protein
MDGNMLDLELKPGWFVVDFCFGIIEHEESGDQMQLVSANGCSMFVML